MGEKPIQRILADGLSSAIIAGFLSGWHISVLKLLTKCRTGALGYLVLRCEHVFGHPVHFFPNSCGNRICRTCSAQRIEKRLNHEKEHFLNAKHHQLVFTLPPALRPFFSFNRKLVGDLLLKSTMTTVTKVLADPKFMGGLPGIVAFLHTWNQQMNVHPHVHLLVSAVGLGNDRRLVNTKMDRLAPHQLLAAHWASTFSNMLRRAVSTAPDSVQWPDGMDAASLNKLLRELKTSTWHVHTTKGTPSGHALKYNVSYSIGGCIGNSRIVSYDGEKVVIRCRTRRDQKKLAGPSQLITMSNTEFVRRFAQHIPDKHQRVIAHGGLYSCAAKNGLLDCTRKLLNMKSVVRLKRTVKDLFEAMSFKPRACEVCGGKLCPAERLTTGPPRRYSL